MSVIFGRRLGSAACCCGMVPVADHPNSECTQQNGAHEHEHGAYCEDVELQGEVHVACLPLVTMAKCSRTRGRVEAVKALRCGNVEDQIRLCCTISPQSPDCSEKFGDEPSRIRMTGRNRCDNVTGLPAIAASIDQGSGNTEKFDVPPHRILPAIPLYGRRRRKPLSSSATMRSAMRRAPGITTKAVSAATGQATM